ncbi:hypothetical protein PHJA_000551500 [Phtheirospermum japonicum]|uniref:Uncharacterized protein n=1 Tax=Phtheirospermum japonicum TaxID=374723 RepID=A0A830BFM5_9LAMI|nr:hypothetical protein PHJA_000551500 [Phtheirospermum japonicum]
MSLQMNDSLPSPCAAENPVLHPIITSQHYIPPFRPHRMDPLCSLTIPARQSRPTPSACHEIPQSINAEKKGRVIGRKALDDISNSTKLPPNVISIEKDPVVVAKAKLPKTTEKGKVGGRKELTDVTNSIKQPAAKQALVLRAGSWVPLLKRFFCTTIRSALKLGRRVSMYRLAGRFLYPRRSALSPNATDKSVFTLEDRRRTHAKTFFNLIFHI